MTLFMAIVGTLINFLVVLVLIIFHKYDQALGWGVAFLWSSSCVLMELRATTQEEEIPEENDY